MFKPIVRIFYFYFRIFEPRCVQGRKYQLSFVRIGREECEDTKGIIKCRNSKKDIQYNGQKKRDKKTNNGVQHSTQ